MANTLYSNARQMFLTAQLNWVTDTVKACLIDTTKYTIQVDSDLYFSVIPSNAIVGSVVTLTNKVGVLGAADANDTTFSAVSGPTIGAVILFKDTGDPSTSPLIAYIDSAVGLPITPNGGDIIITWDNGTNRIFRV